MIDGGEIDGKFVEDFVVEMFNELKVNDNVILCICMMGVGVYDYGYVLGYECVVDYVLI